MRIERGLQPNHSEWMRLVATLEDEEKAQTVHAELVRHLEELFSRGAKFSTGNFWRSFETEEEFMEWRKKEWDPVADKSCTLSVEKRDGRIHVSGNYGLVIDDWSKGDLKIALDGIDVVLLVYTAGYGVDHVATWLQEKGAEVEFRVEGPKYEYRSFDDAVEEVKGQAGEARDGGVRTENSDDASV